tara:strand:- start:12 stop:470 length:459 start_codon:yes stop_codon:yes gene_type:complete
MAVPTSGPLSQLKMAREAKHADYNGSQSMGTISLYDLVNGGQANGSTVDYPAINTGCLPNPASRASLQLTNVGQGMGGGAARTLYYNANIGAASNLTAGDYLYTNSSLTTAEGTSFNGQPGSSATTTACGAGDTWYFDTNSSGVIQQNVLCQ